MIIILKVWLLYFDKCRVREAPEDTSRTFRKTEIEAVNGWNL